MKVCSVGVWCIFFFWGGGGGKFMELLCLEYQRKLEALGSCEAFCFGATLIGRFLVLEYRFSGVHFFTSKLSNFC